MGKKSPQVLVSVKSCKSDQFLRINPERLLGKSREYSEFGGGWSGWGRVNTGKPGQGGGGGTELPKQGTGVSDFLQKVNPEATICQSLGLREMCDVFLGPFRVM